MSGRLLFISFGLLTLTALSWPRHSAAVMIIQGSAKQDDQKDAPKCKLPEVRKELLERMEVDQKARRAINGIPRDFNQTQDDSVKKKWQPLIEEIVKVDRENVKWLKPLIEKHGWLGKSLVGKDGAFAAWLLVQHADRAPKFQRKCLDLMTSMPKGEVSPRNLGYLTDRVLIAEGKPQRYGTQIEMVDGKARPKKVEDPDNLNKRRAEIGLDTIEEYLKLFK